MQVTCSQCDLEPVYLKDKKNSLLYVALTTLNKVQLLYIQLWFQGDVRPFDNSTHDVHTQDDYWCGVGSLTKIVNWATIEESGDNRPQAIS